MGCNSQGVVSPYNLKQALDIVYNETKDMKFIGYGSSELRAMFLQDYLKDRKYHNNMECGILDMSDVQGTKHIRACLLKNVHKDISNKSKDVSVLVMAEKSKDNSDIILLMFFDDAEKTEKGYKYSTVMPIDILVNLKTHKIGNP